jgi:hypothetical protein
MAGRLLRVLFAIYVAAALVHIAWIVHHEPFTFDAWNMAIDTHSESITPARFFDYWSLEYHTSNPRLGQAFTYLAYKLEYFAVIATPLAYLALTLGITVLGLGRWPWRRARDLALWAIVIGGAWFALPELGKTMFCRAYGANYVYGAAIQLAFLVPMRLYAQARSPVALGAYAMFGLNAGMCNEHTGPTLLVLAVAYALWLRRRTGRHAPFVWAGTIGFALGFAAIFFAPGQDDRYDGLATKVSLFGRLLQRGIVGNLEILRDLLVGLAPLLALIAIACVIAMGDEPAPRKPALRGIAIALLAGTAMAATIFVSPKLGSRFYLLSASLLFAGFVALADAVLITRRRLVPFVALAVVTSAYAAMRTIPVYAHAKRASDARIAALETAPKGRVLVLEAFDQIEDTWWFLGDDFRDSRKRDMVARYVGLPGIALRSYDPLAPLGVAGARFVPHYRISPQSCIDDHGGFSLGSYKGTDLPGIHRELKVSIELLRERLGTAGRLDELELAVELEDPHLVLPRPRVVVARWRPDRFEAYVGQLVRRTAAFSRDVVVPPELVDSRREVYVYLVGDEARRLGTTSDALLRYVPWRTGVYWILACGADDCFVIAAQHQS